MYDLREFVIDEKQFVSPIPSFPWWNWSKALQDVWSAQYSWTDGRFPSLLGPG